MILVQCPSTVLDLPEDDEDKLYSLVFLGGGISGCKDWQKEMIARFKDVDELILVNPRRDNFDTSNPAETEFQIWWEYTHLHVSNAVLFWFPYETLCPITLYELGVCAARGQQIFVGCHPAYARKVDVQEQLKLLRPSVVVHDNFSDLVSDVMHWYDESRVAKQ